MREWNPLDFPGCSRCQDYSANFIGSAPAVLITVIWRELTRGPGQVHADNPPILIKEYDPSVRTASTRISLGSFARGTHSYDSKTRQSEDERSVKNVFLNKNCHDLSAHECFGQRPSANIEYKLRQTPVT